MAKQYTYEVVDKDGNVLVQGWSQGTMNEITRSAAFSAKSQGLPAAKVLLYSGEFTGLVKTRKVR